MQGTMQHTIIMYWNYEFTVVVLEFVLPEKTGFKQKYNMIFNTEILGEGVD